MSEIFEGIWIGIPSHICLSLVGLKELSGPSKETVTKKKNSGPCDSRAYCRLKEGPPSHSAVDPLPLLSSPEAWLPDSTLISCPRKGFIPRNSCH